MNNQNITTHCKEQIKAALQALRTPYKTIKSLFRFNEMTEINYSYKTVKDTIREIRFKNATLNCLFDQYNICNDCILFFDNQIDIFHYIEYCYRTYKYNYESHSWINNEYRIQVYTKNDEAGLHFYLSNPDRKKSNKP